MKIKLIVKVIILGFLTILCNCASINRTKQMDVDGKTIEYQLSGNGTPTIVFETGMGQTIDTWSTILDSLSKHTKVYAYNRPGYGKSATVNPPKNVIEVAKQLRKNLIAQNINPPFILVGHSVGGLYVNMFTRLYPEDVPGVVFIDASHPEQFEYFKNNHSLLYELLITSIKKGNRIYEYEIVKTALKSFDEAPKFPNTPITVLTAGKKSSLLETKKLREMWLRFQNDLVGLSPEGRKIIIEDSGHYIHRKNPDLTISEILRIMNLYKNKL